MSEEKKSEPKNRPSLRTYGLVIAIVAALTFLTTWLLFNVRDRKDEAREVSFRLADLSEETIDPEIWGKNFPRQYDGYKRTTDTVRTKYGGSEAFQRLDAEPALRRIFAGYAFSLDYRRDRGHAFMLLDQDMSRRVKERKQPGACLHCHSSIIPVYRKLGDGDVEKGFEKVCAMSYEEGRKLVDHPIACIDCHNPKTMELRVTRPGFLNGIKALMKRTRGIDNYDPNTMATRQEMRTYVCGQCHVEYFFKGDGKLLTYPWFNGLKVEQIEAYYDSIGFKDWLHEETGAPVLKAQHPEFEIWNQGIHARSGVACADCHMPYKRDGAVKVSDHHVRSPILNISRACQSCHPQSEEEIKARVEIIQDRTRALITRTEDALLALYDEVKAAKRRGATDASLEAALKLQRKSQWRFDFVAAENSTGFHAPQEVARILAEAIDYARQGELAAQAAK
ncbi:MAG TPA: ammonia-forming cytochrome c nitrite reductase subunit c552 [Bacteroidota bacterium]|nr:ammonia-forming cytochrome c nitrite reductase subunit c552 [Bacteroidota bacterium]